MGQMKRFVDWCREPSRIKVNRFRPTNSIVLISATILFSSILAVLFFQQASMVVVSIMNPVIWGGDEYEYPRRILSEGDFIYVIGRTQSFGVGDSNMFLLKYDQEGELLWDVIWDNPSTDYPEEFAIYEDSIIVTGFGARSEEEDTELFLLKFDSGGQLIWDTEWGGVGWEGKHSIDYGNDVEVLDGEIYVVGVTTNKAGSLHERDFLLLKYDSDGELLWQKQYGENQSYEYGDCLEIYEGELFVASHRLTVGLDGSRLSELYLIKLDDEGKISWNRTYDDVNSNMSISVNNMIIEDESIYVTGGIRLVVGYRFYLSKFDLNGDFQWIHILDEESYYIRGGIAVVDDHILLMADENVDIRNREVILFDFDQEGNLLGNFTWGTSKNETAWDMRVVEDRVYLMGQISSSSDGEVDIYLTAIENPYASVDEPKRKGIPAFPVISIIVGLGISSLLIKSRHIGD